MMTSRCCQRWSIGDIRSVAMNVCVGSKPAQQIVISRPPYLLPRRW